VVTRIGKLTPSHRNRVGRKLGHRRAHYGAMAILVAATTTRTVLAVI
jgi:hypothetical protein